MPNVCKWYIAIIGSNPDFERLRSIVQLDYFAEIVDAIVGGRGSGYGNPFSYTMYFVEWDLRIDSSHGYHAACKQD
jgi:hypothetical protein